MVEEKQINIWIDTDTSEILDDYRATKRPVLSKKDAIKDLVRIGWESVQMMICKKEKKK